MINHVGRAELYARGTLSGLSLPLVLLVALSSLLSWEHLAMDAKRVHGAVFASRLDAGICFTTASLPFGSRCITSDRAKNYDRSDWSRREMQNIHVFLFS